MPCAVRGGRRVDRAADRRGQALGPGRPRRLRRPRCSGAVGRRGQRGAIRGGDGTGRGRRRLASPSRGRTRLRAVPVGPGPEGRARAHRSCLRSGRSWCRASSRSSSSSPSSPWLSRRLAPCRREPAEIVGPPPEVAGGRAPRPGRRVPERRRRRPLRVPAGGRNGSSGSLATALFGLVAAITPSAPPHVRATT